MNLFIIKAKGYLIPTQKPSNDLEAGEMLQQLQEYYQEPVMPMSEYCKAFRTWAECMERNNTDPELTKHGWHHGEEYYKYLYQITTDIEKSALLYRLLYRGEDVRTKMCPEHQGHWNGPIWVGVAKCEQGCHGTGWLQDER